MSNEDYTEYGIKVVSSAWIRIQCKNACCGSSPECVKRHTLNYPPNPLETSTSRLTYALKKTGGAVILTGSLLLQSYDSRFYFTLQHSSSSR